MKTTNYKIFEKLAENFEETRRLAGKYAHNAPNGIALVSNLMKEITRLRDIIEKIGQDNFSFMTKEEADRFNFLKIFMENEDETVFLNFKSDLIRKFCQKSLE